MEMSASSGGVFDGGKQNEWANKIKAVRDIENFRKTESSVEDLINYDSNLRKWIDENDAVTPTPESKTNQADVEPIIIDNDGQVIDGYNRIATLHKQNYDGPVPVLAGVDLNFPSVKLAENANDVILGRLGDFTSQLKLAVKNFRNPIYKNKKMVLRDRSESDTFFIDEREGIAGALSNATTVKTKNTTVDILDDELLLGIGVDILNVLKANKGGQQGGEVFEGGAHQYIEPKNINKLQEEIGESVERRIVEKIREDKNLPNNISRVMEKGDKRALGSGLIEFARGNFGRGAKVARREDGEIISLEQQLSEGMITKEQADKMKERPSLISEVPSFSSQKGIAMDKTLLTTSDYYDNWYKPSSIKQNIKGNNGKRWIEMFNGPIDPALPSGRFPGKWKVDKDGNIIDTPYGQTKEDFLAGRDKSKYSLSKFDPEVLNILAGQKVGVDKGFFSAFKILSNRGFFKDTGMSQDEYVEALVKSGRTPKEDEIMTSYYADLDDSKKRHIALENAERFKEGKAAMTEIEKINAFAGKGKNKVRKDITDLFREDKSNIKSNKYDQDVDNIIQDFTNIGREKATVRNAQKSQRSIRNRLINEITRRFKIDPEARVYTTYRYDYRGRVYAIDASGANVQTGGVIRHTFNFAEGVPITYGDSSYKRIIDDLVLFEEIARDGSKIKKQETSGLERYAYFKKNEKWYLEKAEELRKALDSDDAEIISKFADSSKSWLKPNGKPRGDAGPFIRALLEIGRIKHAADNGKPYESKMALEFDAPQSGSQHIGAQYGDTGILWKTSVYTEDIKGSKQLLSQKEIDLLNEGVPRESKSPDLYMDVGIDYNKNFIRDLEALSKIDPEKAQLYAEATEKFMGHGRGVVKPIVMKVPYGASMKRLSEDLFKQLGARKILALKEAGIDPKEFMKFHWTSMEDALNSGLKTQFEFKNFNKALGNVFQNAMKVTKKQRTPLLVNSPFGGKTDFTVYASQLQRAQGEISGNYLPDLELPITMQSKGVGREDAPQIGKKTYNTTETTPVGPNDPATMFAYKKQLADGSVTPEDLNLMAIDRDGLDMMVKEGKLGSEEKRSMYGALAPNGTHSIDAGFLQELVKRANKLGIPAMVVHDAFFIRPTDVDAFRNLAGEVFQDLHNGYNLRKEMIKGVAKSTGLSEEKVYLAIEAQLKEANPDAILDAKPGFRSGYIIDRLAPENKGLSAEQGGPLGPQTAERPAGVVGQQSGTGETVRTDNVIRGG